MDCEECVDAKTGKRPEICLDKENAEKLGVYIQNLERNINIH